MEKGNSLIEDKPVFGRFHEQLSKFSKKAFEEQQATNNNSYKYLCLLCIFDCQIVDFKVQ